MLRHHYFWPDRPALRAARWTTGGGGESPGGNGGARKCSVGGMGAGAILAARNHQKGQRLQIRKMSGRLGIRRENGKGVHGFSGKSEMEVLGSAPRGVEWGGMCKRSQWMGKGEQNRTDDRRKGSEGN